MSELGKVSIGADGQYVFQIERRYPKPIEEVWDAITNPARIARWLTDTTYEPTPGSPIVADFGDDGKSTGHVLTFQPPQLFEYTSKAGEEGTDSHVRFELSATSEDETLLILTHSRQTAQMVPLTAPGWHACVEALQAEVSGKPVDRAAIWQRAKFLYVDTTSSLE